MKRSLFPLVLAALPTAALAQDPDRTSYDRCLIQAGIVESYRDVPGEAIFGLAQRRCAAIRASLRRDGHVLAALDASDATKAANFPDWMMQIRERRRLRDTGLPIPADPGYR